MLWTALALLFSLLALGIPIAAVLGVVALGFGYIFSPMPLYRAMGQLFWTNGNSFLLLSLPLFILMGELMLRAGIAEKMYNSLAQWLSWLPGGLMHANIGASAIFAATSGSSVATAATIGTVAVPQIERHNYNARIFLGSIAASGTLGILIPPSVNLIVYGLLTHTSVPQLYLAGFVPGALLALIFMAIVLISCVVWPALDGDKPDTDWRRRIVSLTALGPPLLIFLLVVGSIYMGVATPTEAAALGVIGVALLAAANRVLTLEVVMSALAGTVRATGMVTLIVLTAMFLNFVLTAVGLTGQITSFVLGLNLGPTGTMLVIIAFYLLLGCVMEEFAMILTTTPIVAPIVVSLGYDPVWFGILLVILSQTAMITPPIGLNLFVVHGIRRTGSMNDIMIGIAPFVLTLLLMIALLMLVPGIATWLPSIWYG
mgnify:CR=1 FL=1